MATAAVPGVGERVWRLQLLTLGWMAVEVGVAGVAAWRARSVALGAFGADSVIELLSAGVVLAAQARPERNRLLGKIGGWLLLALAAVIAGTSALALLAGVAPRPSPMGMALLLAAAAVMPWLGRQKRKLARSSGNRALAADAVQSSACAYLAWIALAGLGLNAALGWGWADPVAALGLVPLIAREGWKTTRGEGCGCCC
ncbi:MAG TPA: cation transporter [Terriglobales bacterium]|nr:cation transporter [Terriglobales bacterium]